MGDRGGNVPVRTGAWPCACISVVSPAHVNAAVDAGEDAFWSFSRSTRAERAVFLNRIADEIETRGAEITEIGTQESGLPDARLQGERGRTTGQLRLFAAHILKGDYLDRRHDVALPDRAPKPRSDLKLVQRPIGPVAVFGASNFPLAFSTADGDAGSLGGGRALFDLCAARPEPIPFFGPLGMVVRAKNTEQMIRIAKSLEGQLTCTLQMDQEDTGVEVADSVVHGGPYPASTNFRSDIRRDIVHPRVL